LDLPDFAANPVNPFQSLAQNRQPPIYDIHQTRAACFPGIRARLSVRGSALCMHFVREI
jgi:hypothetical protein